jgi:hypothetical protein
MKFQLEYDARANRVLVELRDLWTIETVREFAIASGSFAHEVRTIRGDYDTLIDSRGFPVQPNDVADLLPSLTLAGLALTSGRAASVVGSHLNKLQAERTQTHPRMRIFMTHAEAEAWLAEAPATQTQTGNPLPQ